MAQSSSANHVEKFKSDRRKGRETLQNKVDNRKKGKVKRGKDHWADEPAY